MYFKENVMLAVNGLRANKMRALLTMLGIIIGISSVIAIVTIGTAMTDALASVLNDMGANSIQLYITDKPDEHGNTNWTRPFEDEDRISDDMIRQYREQFGDKIKALAVSEGVGYGQAMNGRNEVESYIVGVNSDALGIQNIGIVAGHDLSEREVTGAKSVAVISDRFVQKLFPGISLQEALGREIKLRLNQGVYTFMVVGIYHYEVTGFAANMTGDTSNNVFIPIPVAKQINDSSTSGYYSIQVRGNDNVTNTQLFAQQTQDFFNNRFYRSNHYVETRASSMDSMISSMTRTMSTMSLAIGVIAAISLLVGGIGVMNIMLVSVTERTREIGTRKALGAKNAAIQIQFIVESMIICLIGGVLGVALGTALGRLGSTLLGAPGWPAVSVVLIAVGFSMAIGVFFGYYPANKAAKLDPIEALRYE